MIFILDRETTLVVISLRSSYPFVALCDVRRYSWRPYHLKIYHYLLFFFRPTTISGQQLTFTTTRFAYAQLSSGRRQRPDETCIKVSLQNKEAPLCPCA